jgi:hypothetical protein
MMWLLVFSAAFSSVFCLGLNSKFTRDDRIALAFCCSWCITLSQFAMTWAVFESGLSVTSYLISAGLGGSIGITISQYIYMWLDNNILKRSGRK